MQNFNVPTKNQVSESNQVIFDNLKNALGFVPNLFAYIAKSDTALSDFLAFANRKSSLSAKEKEIVNLTVSQKNKCKYCLSAHTQISKMNGFSDEQILEIRKGNIDFDDKLKALSQLTKSIIENNGKAPQETKEAFFSAGFSEVNLIDVIMNISEISTTNLLHNFTDIEIDFPLAQEL